MVKLVQYNDSHKHTLVKLLNNRNVTDWLLMVNYPYTDQDADWWLNVQLKRMNGNDRNFAIEFNGIHIGGIGLHKRDIRSEHTAEIGYWIGEEFWGKGFATDAIKQAVEFGFNNMNVVRITAHIFDGNTGSEKVLIKNGFVQEGFMKKCYFAKGKFLDAKLYAKVI